MKKRNELRISYEKLYKDKLSELCKKKKLAKHSQTREKIGQQEGKSMIQGEEINTKGNRRKKNL